MLLAMVTFGMSYAVTKCAQFSANPSQKHYDAVKNILRYMYATPTRDDGIYFCRTIPNDALEDLPLLGALSTMAIFFEGHPHTQPLEAAGFVDSDWAACVKTRRSMTGLCIHLAGGTVATRVACFLLLCPFIYGS